MKIDKILACIFLAGKIAAQLPTSGLIGAWTFSGNAMDASSSANHGTVYNATPVNDRCGNAGGAFHFNGSAKIVTRYSGPGGAQARSLSFWMRSNNNTTWAPAVAFDYGNNSGAADSWQVVMNYCAKGIGLDNSTQAVIRPAGCLFDNNWHHVVVVLDPAIGTKLGELIFYVDGVKILTQACSVSGTNTTIDTDPIHPVTFGAHAYGDGRFFTGDLDDFYFYDRALSHTEVLNLLNASPCTIAGPGSICSGITSTFSLNAVPGATLYSWSLPAGWTGTSTVNTISVVPANQSGSVTYSVFGNCGMIKSGATNVTIHPAPAVTASASKTLICSNLNETATLSASGAVNYTWHPSGLTGASLTVNPVSPSVFSVTGSNLNNCRNTATVFVNTMECIGVSVEENQSMPSFRAYPNPAGSFIMAEVEKRGQLQLYSAQGVLLVTFDLFPGENIIPVNNRARGLYLLVYSAENIFVSQRIFVETAR